MTQLSLPTLPPTSSPVIISPAEEPPASHNPSKSPKIAKPKDLFTADERYALRLVIGVVKDSMRWNSESEQYEDDGSFILTLEKDEMAALSRALKKF